MRSRAGYRDIRRDDQSGSVQGLLFPDLAEKEPRELHDGSASLTLRTEPAFDRYIFIHIWMGVSVENDRYRNRIAELRSTGAHTKFLSLEPLLGPLQGGGVSGADVVRALEGVGFIQISTWGDFRALLDLK